MIKEIIKQAYLEGGRNWLFKLIKAEGIDFYYSNRVHIKDYLKKDLGFDSSEVSSKLNKFEKALGK